MKALFSKTIVASAVAALSLFASVGASAQVTTPTYNEFTVNPGTLDRGDGNSQTGYPYSQFTANKIIGNYNEVITFDNNGGFQVSLYWSASSFVQEGGIGKIADSGLDQGSAGAGRDGYGLYALYKAAGTVTTVGGVSNFSFTGPGSLEVYFDKDRNTTGGIAARPTTGAGDWNLGGDGEDILLATGVALSGDGELDPTTPSCNRFNFGCGFVASQTTFELEEAGKQFFVAPNPFYNLSFQSGQLNRFPITPNTTIVIDGSLDVVFERAEVPEPASLGLLGLGLLGLGAARRRKQVK